MQFSYVPGEGAPGLTEVQVELVRRQRRVTRVFLYGSATFDVRHVDRARLRVGPGLIRPRIKRARVVNRNRDGYPDLRIGMRKGRHRLRVPDPEAALCVHGALADGTPFVGCARPHTPRERRAAARAEDTADP